MNLTVVSWNLWDYDRPPVDARRQADIVTHLRAIRPDVLCVQEFCDDRLAPAFDSFCGELDMTGHLATADSRYHTAVMWQPNLVELGPREVHNEGYWHSIAAVTFATPAGPLRIGSAHLSPHSADSRLADACRISAEHDPSSMTILGGDWNGTGEDLEYDRTAGPGDDRRASSALTAAGLIDVAPSLDTTWQPTYGHLGGPRARIDAFRATASTLGYIEGYTVDTSAGSLSDHHPIALTLNLV